MNRLYTRERYREIVEALRAAQPEMYFSTDVIVGFPGETEEDFAQTRAIVTAMKYDKAYVLKYSIRTGNPAAELGDQVPEEVKGERWYIGLELRRKDTLSRTAAIDGTIEEVLVEGADQGGTRYTGRTRSSQVCVRRRPAPGGRSSRCASGGRAWHAVRGAGGGRVES